MVRIPDNAKPMTDEEFDIWWSKLSDEKKQEWIEYSHKNLLKR